MIEQVGPPRGMRDFLPAEKLIRERILAKIRTTYRKHGFTEIETPVLENIERLHSGLGGDNEKLSFSVLRRGLDSDQLQAALAANDPLLLADLGLRFDLTVPLARFFATNRSKLPRVFRALQIAPVWRAERPQKGRFRQFVQCDIDILGEPGILAEAELIAAGAAALTELGITGTTLRINDRRLLTELLDFFGFDGAVHSQVLITLDKLDKVGADGVITELSEKGLAESKPIAALQDFLNSPETRDFVGFGERQFTRRLPEGFYSDQIATLLELGAAVAAAGVDQNQLSFDPFLVRGMGYYTGPIFELVHPDFGYSLGGGGRYDGMIGNFAGIEVPAVGLSLGFERLIDLVDLEPSSTETANLLVCYRTDSVTDLLELKFGLINQGYIPMLIQSPKNLKALLSEVKTAGINQWIQLDNLAGFDSKQIRQID